MIFRRGGEGGGGGGGGGASSHVYHQRSPYGMGKGMGKVTEAEVC